MELPLGEVPVTEDTRLACEAAGIPAPVTELAAQSALAILRELTDPDGGEPPCHAKEFNPEARKCLGCVYLPTCWPKDHGYLRRLAGGSVPRPPKIVPDEHVARALARIERLPAPPPAPKRKGPPPSPPAPRKRRVKPPGPPRRS